MKRNVKNILVRTLSGCAIIIITAFAISCNNSKPTQPPAPKINTSKTLKDLQRKMSRRVIDTSIPKTTILFNAKILNFGTIKTGDVVTQSFIITNTGTNPLSIYNVQGTCGCTVPHWPAKPVLPGDTGHITVQYNSFNESGLQNKKVRVFTNTKPMETDVFFKANVKN